jgi:hypothetical protein
MHQFKDFGIKPKLQSFVGDKIKLSKVLNREVTIHDFRIEDSKYGSGNSKCLYLQIELNDTKHVMFTGSKSLIEMIEQVPKSNFPFKTTIITENERPEFT